MALLLMIQSAYDIWHAQSDFTSIIESQVDPLDLDSEAHPDIIPSTAMSRRLFLISFVLCTSILICSIDVSLASLASLIAFLVTAPGHLAFYVASVPPRNQARTRLLTFRCNAVAALLLVVLWCWVCVANILGARSLWRRIVMGILSGLEVLLSSFSLLMLRCADLLTGRLDSEKARAPRTTQAASLYAACITNRAVSR